MPDASDGAGRFLIPVTNVKINFQEKTKFRAKLLTFDAVSIHFSLVLCILIIFNRFVQLFSGSAYPKTSRISRSTKIMSSAQPNIRSWHGFPLVFACNFVNLQMFTFSSSLALVCSIFLQKVGSVSQEPLVRLKKHFLKKIFNHTHYFVKFRFKS